MTKQHNNHILRRELAIAYVEHKETCNKIPITHGENQCTK